jgi:predicted nucleotidyltransferase
MDIYQLKFTVLQQEILRFLFISSGLSFTGRSIAKSLKVSPTAISKSLKELVNDGPVIVKKEAGRLSISINRENPLVFYMKRAENLKLVYESGLVGFLENSFPGATIVLFGSFSFGEDINTSDIDLAMVGVKEKDIDLGLYEKILKKKISLNFYPDFGINKNLKESIANGIVLKGAIQL